jgi:hypothetical protein
MCNDRRDGHRYQECIHGFLLWCAFVGCAVNIDADVACRTDADSELFAVTLEIEKIRAEHLEVLIAW